MCPMNRLHLVLRGCPKIREPKISVEDPEIFRKWVARLEKGTNGPLDPGSKSLSIFFGTIRTLFCFAPVQEAFRLPVSERPSAPSLSQVLWFATPEPRALEMVVVSQCRKGVVLIGGLFWRISSSRFSWFPWFSWVPRNTGIYIRSGRTDPVQFKRGSNKGHFICKNRILSVTFLLFLECRTFKRQTCLKNGQIWLLNVPIRNPI